MDRDIQRKILTSTALLFLFAIGVYTLYSNKKVVIKNDNNGPKLLASQILTISNIKDPVVDSNNNGIPNWQENILGKDLTMEDLKNLPTIDSSSTGVGVSEKTMERLTDPNNLTTALVKNNLVVAGYARSIGSSTDIDYSGLSDDVLAQTLSSYSFKNYTQTDIIHIIKTPYQTDRKKYGNELAEKTATAIKNYIFIDEREGLKDLVNGSTTSKNISDLKRKIVGVSQFRNSLLSMNVPSDAITYHLGYINAIERYLEVLSAFYNVNDDPLKAALMLRGYKDIVQSQVKFLSDFEDYFSKNNLIFTKKDYGYMFTIGIGNK